MARRISVKAYSDSTLLNTMGSDVYFNSGANDAGDSALNAKQQSRELPISPLRPQRSVAKGALAGAVAGIVGCLAMDLVSRAWISAQQGGRTNEAQKKMTHHGARPDSLEAMEDAAVSASVQPNASTKTAAAASNGSLTEAERAQAGKLVHYVFGAAAGAAYGGASEVWPALRAGFGTFFGLCLWAATIPTSLPLLGLTRRPDQYRVDQHAFGIASHLAYGVAAEGTLRTLRKL